MDCIDTSVAEDFLSEKLRPLPDENSYLSGSLRLMGYLWSGN
jgi:hypothetical protein